MQHMYVYIYNHSYACGKSQIPKHSYNWKDPIPYFNVASGSEGPWRRVLNINSATQLKLFRDG